MKTLSTYIIEKLVLGKTAKNTVDMPDFIQTLSDDKSKLLDDFLDDKSSVIENKGKKETIADLQELFTIALNKEKNLQDNEEDKVWKFLKFIKDYYTIWHLTYRDGCWIQKFHQDTKMSPMELYKQDKKNSHGLFISIWVAKKWIVMCIGEWAPKSYVFLKRN